MIYVDEGPKSLELPGARVGLFGFGLVLLQGALFAIGFGPDLLVPAGLDGADPVESAALGLGWALVGLQLWRARRLVRPRGFVRAAALALGLGMGLALFGRSLPDPIGALAPRLSALGFWFAFAVAVETHFWALPWPRGTSGWKGLSRVVARCLWLAALILLLLGAGAHSASRALAGAGLAFAVIGTVLFALLAFKRPKQTQRQTCSRCGVQNDVPLNGPRGCHDCGLVLRSGPSAGA